MLMVFLSHFSASYSDHPGAVHLRIFELITLIASPAFVFISGMMQGILYERNSEGFPAVRDRIIDRGLFLILVVHPITSVAMWLRAPFWMGALRKLFITDTLGVCLIAGALLMTRLGPRQRARLGAAMLIGGWTLLACWTPDVKSWTWPLKEVLVGDFRAGWVGYGFPFVPWVGLFLVATAAGNVAARFFRERRDRELVRAALILGVTAVAMALLLKSIIFVSVANALLPPGVRQLRHLGSLAEKIPPEPAYVLCFGGLALIMLGLILAMDRTRAGRAINHWTGLFGRASLACFVVQFYVYYVAVFLLPEPPMVLVPLYFLLTVALMRVVATVWERTGANRIVTVGYRAYAAHRRLDRAVIGIAPPR